ncbi:hypothetical protein B4U37_13505 [Sutcliffiella horikoshii]|uniref:DUF4190 domain-containing protein n=1 Tax=Sutcliffiella horikoshii TaxID=79883 RepID=A0A1Y0CP40_9BACI|nr:MULTISPECIES: DUF4190 domain-containing protein [Bacillaceae]ART76999.1 hypothetical protein B4U37_13505 [Sutcliffiella horikoshii]TYS74445.1 DUF4190 domain-containing protein [Sutcliffiella horikoshii]
MYEREVGTEQTNTKAIISLVFGIVSILLPLIGSIFAIIGLVCYFVAKKEIVLTGEKGHGISVAGLVCSVAGLIIHLLGLLAIVAFMNVGSFT